MKLVSATMQSTSVIYEFNGNSFHVHRRVTVSNDRL